MSVVDKQIICRTRTGKKLHGAHPGSSVTVCGHWLKVDCVAMQVAVEQVLPYIERGEAVRNNSAIGPATLILCEHCFPTERSRSAQHVANYYETWKASS
jgi:hypothetical protein